MRARADQADIIQQLQDSMYVDDCINNPISVDATEEFKKVSVHALSKAGMNLHKWRGNGISDDQVVSAKVLGFPLGNRQ